MKLEPTPEQVESICVAIEQTGVGGVNTAAGIAAWNIIAPMALESAAVATDERAESWADKSSEGYVAIHALRGMARHIRTLKGGDSK